MVEYQPDSGPQTLVEVNLRAERRRLMDGDEPLPTDEAVGRVIWSGGGSIEVDDPYPDSRTRMRLPSPVLDDERLPQVTVDVLIGYHALVLIYSDQPVPGQALRALADRSARELLEAVDLARHISGEGRGFEDARDVADGIRYAALAILRGRLAEVEQSVRDALSDEHVTEEDYAALREYPARLAAVEEHARAIRFTTWESLQPKSPYPTAVLPPATPATDYYFEGVNELESEARQAVATLSGLVSSQQVVIVQRQRLEVERLQRVVTLIGATVLVPGLVAAVFGANFNFPGEGTTGAFWGMLLLMVAGGLGSYTLLRSAELGLSARIMRGLRLPSLPERTWLIALGTVALTLALVGFLIVGRS